MPDIILYIISAIAIGLLILLFVKIQEFLKSIYTKVQKIAFPLTRAVTWYYEAFLNLFKRKNKEKERRLSAFGGIGRLVIMIILLGISAFLGYGLVSEAGEFEELFLILGVKTPPMFLLSVIINLQDFSIFNFADMVQTAVTGAILIAFFLHDKNSENINLNGVVRIVYSAIFSAFFLLISYAIPSEFFLFPLSILSFFTDFFSFLGHMLTSYPLGIAGILAAIVTAALYLAVVFVTLYGIFCLLIVTLREFIASVIISLIPTVILAVVVLVVDSLFPDLSDTIANLSMFGLILALMVVSNIIRSRMEEDAEIEIDRIEEVRKTKRERRATRRKTRAVVRNKSVYIPEDPTEYIPIPTYIYRTIRHTLAEAYRRNA